MSSIDCVNDRNMPRAPEGRPYNNTSMHNHHKVNRFIPHSRMNRILYLILPLLLVEQQVISGLAWAPSAIPGRWPSKQNATWNQLRGGQDVDNEDSEEVDAGEEKYDGGIEAKKVDKSIDMCTTDASKQSLKLRSAFRLLQDMREEVVSLAHIMTDSNENVQDQKGPANEHLVETALTSRQFAGGALAIQSQQKEKEVLTAPTSIVVDANRVAPLSSRLLEEIDDVKEDFEDGLEANGISRANDFSKLWWPNLWTQQLAELQTVSKIANDFDNEEESEPDVMEEMDAEETTEDSDNDMSSANREGELNDMVTDSQGKEDEIKVEIIPIPPEVKDDHLTDSDNDLSRQPLCDESSFVSSGAVSCSHLLGLNLHRRSELNPPHIYILLLVVDPY